MSLSDCSPRLLARAEGFVAVQMTRLSHPCWPSIQPAIIKYALDNYAPKFASSDSTGPHQYKENVYTQLGL